MDVLVGPTFSIDVSSYGPPPQDNNGGARLFLKKNGVFETQASVEEASSDTSSSIGAPDDSEDESKGENGDGDDSDEVQSKFNGGGLGSLGSFGSLEDSLPIKRGLSNYFSGKSKSFASLAEVSSSVNSVKEVEKRDNPFNKRRRVLIASKWSRKSSSFYNWPNPKSMPLLALNEDEEQEDHHHHQEQENPSDPSDQSSSDEKEQERRAPKKFLDRRLKSFKSQSCYCLSDLQEHE